MNLDFPKIIEAIKDFNKPLVFLAFGLLAYLAIPFTVLGLQLDWIPKIKVTGLLSIFIGVALAVQKLWDWNQQRICADDKKNKLKKALTLLNADEEKIIKELTSKGCQSCAAPIHTSAYFSLVSKKIAYFGETKISNRYFDFHIADEAWEILEQLKKR